MKILMINHFPLAGSGSGTYTKNLAVHLAALGHEVCVILPENTDDYERIPNVRLHPVYFTPQDAAPVPGRDVCGTAGTSAANPLPFNFPCFTSHPRSTVTFADLDDEQMAQYTGAFTRAIEEEMASFAPDIIHGQHVWILPALAADCGVPIVLTAHGTDLMGYDKWPHLRSYAEHVMERCSYVISISKDNCELLSERFPRCRDKVVMMRNGYDPGVFYPQELTRAEVLESYGIPREDYDGKKIVLFAGKLAHFKGVDILLDAVNILEGKRTGDRPSAEPAGDLPDALTLIVGDGDERDKLHAQAKRLGLKSVRFLGNVDQKALCRLYNIADVSLVPSRREPFGLVAIEAMACGIPVIASNQGGLPDFVNDDVGALVRPEDAADLARAIREVLAREEMLAQTSLIEAVADPAPGQPFMQKKSGLREWREKIAAYARAHYAQDMIIRELEELYRRALQ